MSVSSVRRTGHAPPSMVERMTLILDAFAAPGERLSLEEVVRRTGLPRSTAHRILEQLANLAWLEHSSLGYQLGRRARTLGGGRDETADLRAAAAPILHSLMVDTGLTVHLAVLAEDQIHYLDKLGGRSAARVPSRVGGRAPAHCTALGLAMLAWLPAEDVDALLPTTLITRTRRSIASRADLHSELNRIRARRGIAFEHGECVETISCVAAAIRSADGPVAAISLVGEINSPLERIAPVVLDAARRVSKALFPTAPQGQMPATG